MRLDVWLDIACLFKTRAEAQNSLRVSLGWDSTLEQVDAFVDTLKTVVDRLRSLNDDKGETCHV